MADPIHQLTSIDRLKEYSRQIEHAEKTIHGRTWIPCIGKQRKALNTILDKVELIKKEFNSLSRDTSISGPDKQALLESAEILTKGVKKLLDENNNLVNAARTNMTGWQKVGEAICYLFKALFGSFVTPINLDTSPLDQQIQMIAKDRGIVPNTAFTYADLQGLCTDNVYTDIKDLANDDNVKNKIEGCWKVRYTGLKDYLSSFIYNDLPFEIDQVVSKNNTISTVTYKVESRGESLKLVPKVGGEAKQIAYKDFYKEFNANKKLDDAILVARKIQLNLGEPLSPEEKAEFADAIQRVSSEGASMAKKVKETYWYMPGLSGSMQRATDGIQRAISTATNTQHLSLNMRIFQKRVDENLETGIAKLAPTEMKKMVRSEISRLIDDLFPLNKFPPYDKSLSPSENFKPLAKRKAKT